MGRFALLVTVAIVAFLAACGDSTETDEATPAPAVEPTTASPDGEVDEEVIALGKEIFEVTGGGVGCAWCHGMEGEGDGPSGIGAPPNRGATKDRLEWALDGGETDAMTFIELKSKEKTAVLAYLKFLDEQFGGQ